MVTAALNRELLRNNSPEIQSLKMEMWAGVECTVNRVGDRFFNQLERNGHGTRLDDLNLFAELGIRTIRYPVIWELIAPNGLQNADWSWADRRLEYLQELGIRPIVGLVHHGSGPSHTSLIDRNFAPQLAQFAQAVQERYPWVELFTPVNEPLTTARFSGLYGHWYPHGRDNATFICALLTQCRAIVLSMQAIRQVNPTAKLVQTEDLCKVFSTPFMAYQAQFENERRWLSLDLLCGRVNREHPLWGYLCWSGVSVAELEWFLANPCPPDMIGMNHYLTSDRFLDERLERYPHWTHGGNGRHQYADVEAVRVCVEGIAGPSTLIKETWERYQLPIAVTEVHHGCTREEQLRWLKEVWDAATSVRAEGVDIRAITAWSLLGSYDWNSLVTRVEGCYESGVFDLRSPKPRPTALARMLRDLATKRTYDHPVLDVPGWWHRQERLIYPPVSVQRWGGGEMGRWGDGEMGRWGDGGNPKSTSTTPPTPLPPHPPTSSPRSVAIVGARGTLGQAFARICEIRGIPYHLLCRQKMDITDPILVDRTLTDLKPWAVINAAGYVRVDDAEREPDACLRVNALGPAILADACAMRGVELLTFSSDLVFDGTRAAPYVESDVVSPLNVYGRSKAEAEARVLKAHPTSLVVRTSAFFGPWDEYNFVTIALRTLASGQPFLAAADSVVSPTYVPDLVNACLDLLVDGECGLWHLANPGASSWADLAKFAAKQRGLDVSRIEACSMQALSLLARRPSYSVLGSERGVLLPPLENAIDRYFHECQILR
ncbi:family 1 glycosylhydrolase [Aerosakkonemataceae cyanobacterium BLCC-F50]|uniref:dTDP-4-dehydrorhamnose reductase n=1 Tax=Floridaenema flaviceps BLCC-F50 TaxID=3153642 RepID=A0ABV4XP30_9CYAN